MSAPRVLILASRQQLEVLEPAARLALEAIGAQRAGMSDVADTLRMFDNVDVVLADVTRPSPAISFELGVAAALDVPTVFVATDVANVSPVFAPVVVYDRDDSAARIGYRFARHLEDAVNSPSRRPGEDRSGEVPPLPPQTPGSSQDQAETYQRGEVIEGPVVHVNTDGGFALVRSGERRPAMLHISRMSPSLASAFEDGELVVGDTIRAEVVEVDEDRAQVQLRDLEGSVDAAQADARSDLIAVLLRRWGGLEQVVGPGLRLDKSDGDEAYRRFLAIYEKELAQARRVRNSAAHGEAPSEAELRNAIAILDELRRVVRADT